MKKIMALGFQQVGKWVRKDDEPKHDLDQLDQKDSALKGWIYAFVSGGALKYIGQTERPLSGRMTNIQNNKEQSAERFRTKIRQALKREGPLLIYALHE